MRIIFIIVFYKKHKSTILNKSYFQCSFQRLCKNKSLFRRFPLSLFRLYLWLVIWQVDTFVRLHDKNSRSGPRFVIKKMLLENKHILKQM